MARAWEPECLAGSPRPGPSASLSRRSSCPTRTAKRSPMSISGMTRTRRGRRTSLCGTRLDGSQRTSRNCRSCSAGVASRRRNKQPVLIEEGKRSLWPSLCLRLIELLPRRPNHWRPLAAFLRSSSAAPLLAAALSIRPSASPLPPPKSFP